MSSYYDDFEAPYEIYEKWTKGAKMERAKKGHDERSYDAPASGDASDTTRTIDKTTPYWEQDIVECLRIAANAVGENSYYLRAAEYIEELRVEKRAAANELEYLKEQVHLLRQTNKASQVYRLSAEQKLQRVLDFLNDDAIAVKHQTIGEYRAAALNLGS